MKKRFRFLLVASAFLACVAGPGEVRAQAGGAPVFDAAMLSEWHWRLLGPSMPAGRAWQVVGVESDPKTLYVTTAGGGLWKTTNHGTTFEPVFEHQPVASTGAVAVAKANPDVVWLGTGEPANTRANSWGNGVYRSDDGGATWTHKGLDDTFLIPEIVIHPDDPDVVWVCALGHLWGTNEERGVFKTTDGGATWTKVLYVSDTTGCNDLQIDPKNPDVLYAAMWQRWRFGGGDMDEAGPESGIFKTTDGGATWTRLTNGLPTDDMGKIHLAVARHDTRIVYAAILTGEPARGGRTSTQGGIFRSDDGGASWTRVNPRMTSYYYHRIYVDPSDDETVWMPVFELIRSTDGGRTFEKVNMRHVHDDLHSMWIDPNDPDHIALSGDGGVSITFDGAKTWLQTTLPIGQFYEVSVDDQDPYHVIGGMQDTGHWLGPHRTYDEEGITPSDWIKLRFNGDGMASATDPRDPNVLFMVQEFGNTSRLDLRTWARTELQPRDPDTFRAKGLTHPVRWNWTPAFLQSMHDPDVLYLGSNYLFRINALTGDWDAISPDLTWQQDRVFKGIEDGYHSYGTIFSVAESPLDARMLWAGADDGPIWCTRDGGTHWTRLDENLPGDAPEHCVVAEIEASRFDAETAYVALDCHARDDLHPYLYATTDGGRTWSTITSNLPAHGSSYVVREDPANPDVLYAGTEFGVFVSIDRGGRWVPLQNNLPTAGVRTLAIQPRDRDLVAGTFGRAIWVTDIGPFAELTPATLAEPLHVFAVAPATRFRVRVTYGNTIEELNGDPFFRAENPPYGTTITYYLRDDVPEGARLTIRDGRGAVVRTLTGPGTAGLHRVVWDLKSDATAAEPPPREGLTPSEWAFRRLVPLGTYTVTVDAGGHRAERYVNVRPEPDGVRQVPARK